MARPIALIYQQLLAQKNSDSNLSGLTSNSKVSIWGLWLWLMAAAQGIFEQLTDAFIANTETIVAYAPVMSLPWIAQICKVFQYSASNPQVINLNISNTYPFFTVGYPVIDTSLQVITQAAAINNNNSQIVIKVASNSSPLSSPQLAALKSYLNNILSPDINYVIITLNADLLIVQGQVFFDAAYSGVIQANMNAAINAYLVSIPFNGIVTVSALEEAMLAVSGVKDVVLQNIYWRKSTDPSPSGGIPPSNNPNSPLVKNEQLMNRNYQTYAGYVIIETTSGYTLNDTITYTAQ